MCSYAMKFMNKAAHPWAECVDGPWDLRKAVRRRLRENPDAIKIGATGGGIWRWETAMDQHYTMEEVQAVADECSMRHIPVWSHCFGSVLFVCWSNSLSCVPCLSMRLLNFQICSDKALCWKSI